MQFGRGSAGHSSKGQMTRIKQVIVRRPGRYRQSHEKLIKRGLTRSPVSPDRYPTRLASSAAGSFPDVGRTSLCGANGTALSVLMAWQIPR